MPRKMLNAGDLRHRISIQERIETQDAVTGAISWEWQTVNDERGNWSSIPAHLMALSAREFEAAAAIQAETSTRFVIRWMEGVIPKMRLNVQGFIYDIKGVLPDLESGREYLTLSCTAGVNDG